MLGIRLFVFTWTIRLLDRLFKGTADNIVLAIKGKHRDIFIYPKNIINMGTEEPKTRNPNLRVVKNETTDEPEGLH